MVIPPESGVFSKYIPEPGTGRYAFVWHNRARLGSQARTDPYPAVWGLRRSTGLSLEKTLVTSRLEVRPPRELDRARFIELFCKGDFMIFSDQALSPAASIQT
jgi:hypothetical protein